MEPETLRFYLGVDLGGTKIAVSLWAEDASRQVKINQGATDLRSLGSRLVDIFKTRNERIIFVKGDARLNYGEVAQIIDIAKGAGIDKIGLITKDLGSSE